MIAKTDIKNITRYLSDAAALYDQEAARLRKNKARGWIAMQNRARLMRRLSSKITRITNT